MPSAPQPACSYQTQVIDVPCPAFTASTPNARELDFVLPCLEMEMLSYRTSLVVHLDQEKNNTLVLVGHISLGIEEISHMV